MKIISTKLYNNIPLFYRLEAMPIKKLIKTAYKEYGITFPLGQGYSKYDIIDDILHAVHKDRETTIKTYTNVN